MCKDLQECVKIKACWKKILKYKYVSYSDQHNYINLLYLLRKTINFESCQFDNLILTHTFCSIFSLLLKDETTRVIGGNGGKQLVMGGKPMVMGGKLVETSEK